MFHSGEILQDNSIGSGHFAVYISYGCLKFADEAEEVHVWRF